MQKLKYLILCTFIACSSTTTTVPETTTTAPETTTTAPETTTTVPETTTTAPETTTTVPETTTTVPETTTTVPETTYGEVSNITHSFDNCQDIKASNLKITCKTGAKIKSIVSFGEDTISSVSKFKNKLYISIKKGLLIEYDPITGSKSELFNKLGMLSINNEGGLLSFAASPTESTYVISYTDSARNLIFEKFTYDGDLSNVTKSEILFSEQNLADVHYAGSVIWSKYYNDYIASIGDFTAASSSAIFNTNPVNTTIFPGKVILLNENSDVSSNIIHTANKDITPKSNIIAYGFRNPWRILEYKNRIIVFDVGMNVYEELNILKYDNTPAYFGWPYYEGIMLTADIYNVDNYSLSIDIVTDSKYNNLEDFIVNESNFPKFTYTHMPGPRSAIIGGDVVDDFDSKYNYNIFFTDFISEEIMSYNILNAEVNLYPVSDTWGITSLILFNDEIVITTLSGDLMFIELP